MGELNGVAFSLSATGDATFCGADGDRYRVEAEDSTSTVTRLVLLTDTPVAGPGSVPVTATLRSAGGRIDVLTGTATLAEGNSAGTFELRGPATLAGSWTCGPVRSGIRKVNA